MAKDSDLPPDLKKIPVGRTGVYMVPNKNSRAEQDKAAKKKGDNKKNSATAECPLTVETGLGREVDKAIKECPRFAQTIKELKEDEWHFRCSSETNDSSFDDTEGKKVFSIGFKDNTKKGKVAAILSKLAYQIGAFKNQPEFVDPSKFSKEEYITKRLDQAEAQHLRAVDRIQNLKTCLEENKSNIKINMDKWKTPFYSEPLAEQYEGEWLDKNFVPAPLEPAVPKPVPPGK